MNKQGFTLPFLVPRRQGNPDLINIQAFLDSFPHPAIIVNSQLLIRYANQRMAEFSGFKKTDLFQLPLGKLIETWQDDFSDQKNQDEPFSSLALIPQTIYFVKRNRTKSGVRFSYCLLNTSEQSAMLIFEPIHTKPRDIVTYPGHDQPRDLIDGWKFLNTLIESSQQSDLDTALNQALRSAGALIEAEIVAVYQAEINRPQLALTAGIGPIEILPKTLPADALVQISKIPQWTNIDRIPPSLHQAAKIANIEIIATAPVGAQGAFIGLVIVATTGSTAHEHAPHVAQILATCLTNIFQHHSQTGNFQAELEENRLRFIEKNTLEENLSEGFLLVTPDLNILAMNPAAEMILGYAGREVVNQPVDKVLIGTETLIPALTAAQHGSATFNLGNVRLYRRNGEAFLALVRVFPIVLEDGSLRNILIFLNDQHEQEEIRIHAQQLEQRAILGEVTAIFAHEVRNPINNISTGLQVMAMNNTDDEHYQKAVARMLQDCDRLNELINGVLTYSRPTDYEMEHLDLLALLKNLLDRLHPRISRMNVEYNLQAAPDCPQINGNLRALEQVFSNLITNAIQAMSEGGGRLGIRVQPITTAEGFTYVEASIADSGPGIPPDLHDRIFQPFYTTQRNGTGLGLAITKRIVTAHKGNIQLTSVPGGTVFHVRIPAANPDK